MFTTARSALLRRFCQNRLLQGLVSVYAAVWVWAAIDPVGREDWLLENLLVFAAVGFSIWLGRTRPLSDLANVLVTAFLILHTAGSHYTYSLVPLGDWMKDAFGFERNHYDRVIHFAFGLLMTYPLRELLLRSGIAAKGWVGFFAFLLISTCSGIYELIEWAAAVVVDPEAGLAFLGTQGDPFDSQKDHALALLGSLLALGLIRVGEGAARR